MDPISSPTTVSQAIAAYLDAVRSARSANTARTYHNAMQTFKAALAAHHSPAEKTPARELSEEAIVWLIDMLKDGAPATERLYITAVNGFYEFLAANRLADPNLPRLKLLIRQRGRRPGARLPQFPRSEIENIIIYINNIDIYMYNNDMMRLRFLRDRAFLITLADTGLRVHEACGLRRGDIDWDEGKAIIIGKGDRQAVVRFSQRSLRALKDYLIARQALDGGSGRPLSALPLFARHDRGAGRKIKPITTATGRNIVNEWVKIALGKEAIGRITPHSFRHYFVTTVLRASGNLKLAQELARHRSITVTQRYAHLSDDELDKGYWEVFEE